MLLLHKHDNNILKLNLVVADDFLRSRMSSVRDTGNCFSSFEPSSVCEKYKLKDYSPYCATHDLPAIVWFRKRFKIFLGWDVRNYPLSEHGLLRRGTSYWTCLLPVHSRLIIRWHHRAAASWTETKIKPIQWSGSYDPLSLRLRWKTSDMSTAPLGFTPAHLLLIAWQRSNALNYLLITPRHEPANR